MLFGKAKVKTPSPAWVKENLQGCEYTPDIAKLEQRKYHLLFVCDDCMRRHGRNEEFLSEDTYRMAAFTSDDELSMWKKIAGTQSFPVPIKGYRWNELRSVEEKREQSTKISVMNLNATRTGRIKGELYKVSTKTLVNLDNHRLNGVQFERQRVKVIIPYRYQSGHVGVDDQEFVQTAKAFMYMGILDFWAPLLPTKMFEKVTDYEAARRKSYDHTIRNYYYYSLHEAKNTPTPMPETGPKKDYFIENAKQSNPE